MATTAAQAARRRAIRGWSAAVAVAAIAWLAGLIWFAEAIPKSVADPDTPTDAVVVLTGASGRLAAGIKIMDEHRARKLFISGVYRGVDVAQILKLARRQGSDIDCCMVLGHDADDTRGNARETADWVHKEGFKSLRLVTSSYHMRRSLLEFRRTMPNIKIIPHPVFSPEFKANGWWNWPGTLQLVITEYCKYLVALMRPW